jgi:hypothetical protein
MRKTIIVLAIVSLFLPLTVIAESVRGEIKPAPWSGDWWSRKKGFLIKGWPGHKPSPFEKYDAYVQSRTGKNPGAHAWEKNPRNHHYNPNADDWEGHCNGWSAASILTPEPRHRRIRNGIVFETADQKGILSELYMNTYCKFYGNRYWGNDNDNIDDIYPDEFHRLLLEYIGSGKSAIICDTERGKQVWNFPLYKYESSWSTGWFDESKLKVKTTVYYVDDGVRPDYIGTKWFSKTYTYNLYLDGSGNIIDGDWTGGSKRDHPDFVWVPTADAPNPPGSNQENPCFDPKFVKEITTGPEKQPQAPRRIRHPDMLIREAGLDPNELF